MAKKTSEKPAQKSKSKAATSAAHKPAQTATPLEIETAGRQLRLPKYNPLKLRRKHKPPVAKVPNAFRIFGRACNALWQYRWLFLGIVMVYGLLNFIFVAGFNVGGKDILTIKASLTSSHNTAGGPLGLGTSLFAYLLGSSSTGGASGTSAYQVLFIIISSLALIWALRQAYLGKTFRVRDAFYRGVSPLTIFVLVSLAIGIQLIPLILGAVLYSTVMGPNVSLLAGEKIAWDAGALLLAISSVYMICSSIFALYIATLPDMTPMKALRSARQLVRYRRWSVIRKVLFAPVALLVVTAVVMLPFIWFATPVAPWAFFVVAMISLALFHSYMYALYRALL